MSTQLCIESLKESQDSYKTYPAICHIWFIVKDPGMEINWKNPLIQKSQIKTKIELSDHPFAEGAMRYAFLMRDLVCKQKLVGKLPKKITKDNYNLEVMSKDIEAMFICSHIVNSFNDIIIGLSDSELLSDFVHSFIYEIDYEHAPNKYYYGENFIEGKYEKYNNNAGWKSEKTSKQAYAA